MMLEIRLTERLERLANYHTLENPHLFYEGMKNRLLEKMKSIPAEDFVYVDKDAFTINICVTIQNDKKG